MTELPAWLGALTGLQALGLGWCKGLTELPASLGALTGLQTLALNGCEGLRELPAWLGALTGLQTLNLGDPGSLTHCRYFYQIHHIHQVDVDG